MPVSKIWIEEGCTSCGLCEDICPEVFNLKDVATVIEDINYADYEEKIKEAAKSNIQGLGACKHLKTISKGNETYRE